MITWITESSTIANALTGDVINVPVAAKVNNDSSIFYSVVSGTLPAGLTLNSTTGRITGSPTDYGMHGFTVRAAAGRLYSDRTFAIVTRSIITWVSPAETSVFNSGASVDQTLSATSSNPNGTVQYTVQLGTLPAGISLTGSHLSGSLTATSGTFSFTIRASDGLSFADRPFTIQINTGPTWVTPAGSIGAFNQMEQFTYTFSATDPDGIASYAIDQTLDETIIFTTNSVSKTATLSGYYVSQDLARPVWQTERGSLGTFNRLVNVNIPIAAQPNPMRTIQSYSILGTSLLPAGVAMTRTGNTATISGSIDLYPAAQSEPEALFTPSPVFTTPAGSLGMAVIGTTFTKTLVATPMLGNAMTRYEVIGGSGNLPFGVSLSQSSGIISGAVDPTAALLDPPASLPAPTFTVAPGSIGTFNNSPSTNPIANIAVTATPTYGNSVVSYSVVGNTSVLPPGLVVGTDGRIVGTVDPAQTAEPEFRLPGPTWVTPSGSLGAAKNGNAVSFGLNVTPLANTTVNLVTLSGAYPSGTVLSASNATSGAFTVSGTLDGNATTTSTTLAADRTFAFTLRALASDGGYADRSFTYTISSN